ncbi:MAG: hypothetical protein AAF633_22175 [Chloroflexota bacterium]
MSCFGTFACIALIAGFPPLTTVFALFLNVLSLLVFFLGFYVSTKPTVGVSDEGVIISGVLKSATIPFEKIFDVDIGTIEKLYPEGNISYTDLAWLGDYYHINGLMVQIKPEFKQELASAGIHHLIYNKNRNESLFLIEDWIGLSHQIQEKLIGETAPPEKSASERFREMVSQSSEYPYESVVTDRSTIFIIGSRKYGQQVKTMLTAVAEVEVITNWGKAHQRIANEKPNLLIYVEPAYDDRSLEKISSLQSERAEPPLLYLAKALPALGRGKIELLENVDILDMPFNRDVIVEKVNRWINYQKRQAHRKTDSIKLKGGLEKMSKQMSELQLENKSENLAEQIENSHLQRPTIHSQLSTAASDKPNDEFEELMAGIGTTEQVVTMLQVSIHESTRLKQILTASGYSLFLGKFKEEIEKIVASQFGYVESHDETHFVLSFGVHKSLDPARQALFSLNSAFGIKKLFAQFTASLNEDMRGILSPSIGIFGAKATLKRRGNGPEETTVHGLPVKLSKLFMEKCRPGEILCGRNTIKPVYKRFVFKSAGVIPSGQEGAEIQVFRILQRIKPEDRARVLA